jgi:hypothetical protein
VADAHRRTRSARIGEGAATRLEGVSLERRTLGEVPSPRTHPGPQALGREKFQIDLVALITLDAVQGLRR